MHESLLGASLTWRAQHLSLCTLAVTSGVLRASQVLRATKENPLVLPTGVVYAHNHIKARR